MKTLIGQLDGKTFIVFKEKGYQYVKYRGSKTLLSGCSTRVRNYALRLIGGK